MSEDFDTEEFDDEEDIEEPPKRKPGKAERQLIREKAELQAQLEAEKRERLFLKVGIPDTPVGRLLVRAYDGELSEDAVRAAAIEAEILEKPKPEVPDEELAAHERVAQVTANADVASGAPQVGSDEYKADLAKAQTPEEWRAVLAKYNSPVAEG